MVIHPLFLALQIAAAQHATAPSPPQTEPDEAVYRRRFGEFGGGRPPNL